MFLFEKLPQRDALELVGNIRVRCFCDQRIHLPPLAGFNFILRFRRRRAAVQHGASGLVVNFDRCFAEGGE